MAEVTIKLGEQYLCRTLEEPVSLPGHLTIEDGDSSVRLVDFHSRKIDLDDGKTIHLQTEEGWYAALLNSVTVSMTRGSVDCPSNQTIAPNTMLVGWTPWDEDAGVRRVVFRLPSVEPVFNFCKKLKSIMAADFMEPVDQNLCAVKCQDLEFRIDFLRQGDLVTNRTTSATPLFEIEFNDNVELNTALGIQRRVEIFFSLFGGEQVASGDVTVFPSSSKEWIASTEDDSLARGHDVYSYRTLRVKDLNELDRLRTLVSFHEEKDVKTFDRCLATWIDRYDEFRDPAGLAVNAIRLRGTISVERLLNATRWLEAIRGSRSTQTISKKHAKALGKLVARNTKLLGYPSGIAGRVTNAVSKVSYETNRERFERLFMEISRTFSPSIMNKEVVEWLLIAFSQRGPAAHGAGDTDDFERLGNSIYALEAFCFLLMLTKLPLDSDQRRLVAQHEFIESYRETAMKSSPRQFKAPRRS